MAVVPQVQGENATFANLFTTGAIPPVYINRGMDNIGALAFITRGYTRFLWMLHQKFPKSLTVKSREFPVHSLTEYDRTYGVTVASTSTNSHTTFGLSNDQAAQIRINDVLIVKNLYCAVKREALYAGQVDSSNANPYGARHMNLPTGYRPVSVHYSRIFGQDNVNNVFQADAEQIYVTEVGAPDSAGTGNCTITVRRCFSSTGWGDRGGGLVPKTLVDAGVVANSDSGAITVGTVLLRALPAFAEGSGAPTGTFKTPEVDFNFTQEFKYALEITKESSIQSHYMGKDPLDIGRMLRARQSSLDQERTFLFGKMGKSMDAKGRVIYTTGGVIESIPHDSKHMIQYNQPTLSYPGLLDIANKSFNLGGSETRYMYCGLDIYTEMQKSFYSSGNLRYDEEASKDFDIQVMSINASGGKIYVFPSYTLQEAGWEKKALILDMDVPAFRPVTHEGYDMKVETDIGEKGTQIYKEQWIAMTGLERRYLEYQSMWDFSNL